MHRLHGLCSRVSSRRHKKAPPTEAMKTIYSLGVMTGTSCDGADAAGLAITNGRETLAHTATKSFSPALRKRLRTAQQGKLEIPEVARLTRDYSEWMAQFCEATLKRWNAPKAQTLIAIHGQTVWHEPESRISVQLVDPTIIAAKTGVTVTAYFRQPDLARGGQGAPLVPYYHWLRATSLREFSDQLPFAIHNVGGIANLTYITKDPKKLFAFDTGPGNALIDLATESFTKGRKHFDKNGAIAAGAAASIDWRAIEKLATLSYFKKKPPKSTGRELFNETFLKKLPSTGAARIANATAFTAHTMAKSYADFVLGAGFPLRKIFVAGGGALNPTLMKLFSDELRRLCKSSIAVSTLSDDFAPAQSLEAMAFARLGYEAIHGRAVSLSAVTGASEDAIGAGIFAGQNYAKLLNSLDLRS